MLCGISPAAGGQEMATGAINRQAEITITGHRCRTCQVCLQSCPLSSGHSNPGCLSVQTIVNQDCITCGACLRRCPYQAVDYQDDSQSFLDELGAGQPLALLVAPAVQRHFPDYRRLFGYLKTLGVTAFYNVLLRADITIWAYVHIMRRNQGTPYISSPCAAVNNYIIKHAPRLQAHLLPVYSPLQCASIYLRKYAAVREKLAFLSPCIAKRGEIRLNRPEPHRIEYSVTINRLQQHLQAAGIDLNNYEPVDFTDAGEGSGQTLGAYGGISECLAGHLPPGQYQKISGTASVYQFLNGYQAALAEKSPLPVLAEVYNCAGGCDSGTGVGAFLTNIQSPGGRQPAPSQRQTAAVTFGRFDRELQVADFIWA